MVKEYDPKLGAFVPGPAELEGRQIQDAKSDIPDGRYNLFPGQLLARRYRLEQEIGRGAWGVVYQAKDTKRSDETVAVKVFDPTPLAREQMKHRGLTLDDVARKEGLKGLEACGNVVRRRWEEDTDRGIDFIVMPLYATTLVRVIEEKNALRPGSTNSTLTVRGIQPIDYSYNGDLRPPLTRAKDAVRIQSSQIPLPTGFTLDEIIATMRDIINGVAEIHATYDCAHCDIKPDNILIDKTGKALITDLGTSTFVAAGASPSPRDNMGCIYTRSPRLFAEGTHPGKSSDCYAVGSLLFYLFTGSYPLQEEIDRIAKDGGMEGLKEYMGRLALHPIYPRFQSNGDQQQSLLEGTLDEKLSTSTIPDEFKRFIRNCLQEDIHDGASLKHFFENAVSGYFERQTSNVFTRELKRNTRNHLAAGLVAGALVTGLAIGAGWVAAVSPKPQATLNLDVYSSYIVKHPDPATVVFECQHRYKPVVDTTQGPDGPYWRAYEIHKEKTGEKTVFDRIASQMLLTANQMPASNQIFSASELMARNHKITGTRIYSPDIFIDQSLRDLTAFYLDSRKTGEGRYPLEDAIASVFVGTHDLMNAQRASGSLDFLRYLRATRPVPGGAPTEIEYIIPSPMQTYLQQLMFNLQKEFAPRVRLRSDSHRPE